MNESVFTKEILNAINFQYNNAIPQNYVLPNKIILGENVVKTLMDQNKLSLYLENENYSKYCVFGIPVVIDRDRKWIIEACYGFGGTDINELQVY